MVFFYDFNEDNNIRIFGFHLCGGEPRIEFNIGDKESSSDLETGAEPHRLELEEEFGWTTAGSEFFIPCYVSRTKWECNVVDRREKLSLRFIL